MGIGKQIRIYLENGTSTGIRLVELVNWTGQAIACPRNKISELQHWDEVQRPGVYFLFGTDEEDNPKAYIGESENVWGRLQDHLAKKDFWQQAVIFSNKDENLTKAHIKYLENRAVVLAKKAARFKLENGNEPTESRLPRGDQDSMNEYFEVMKILVGVCGYLILEEIVPKKESSITKVNSQAQESDSFNPDIELTFTVKGHVAKAIWADEGVVVLRSSEALLETKEYLPRAYKAKRERLIADKVMAESQGRYVFGTEVIFKTPSEAAAVIAGYNMNGRECWKDSRGRSLNEIESEML